jgi:HEAT repeat protein
MTESWPPDPVDRAAAVAAWGLRPGEAGSLGPVERLVSDDPDPRVRAAALGALVRRTAPESALPSWRSALADTDPTVRGRACELAPAVLVGAGADAELLIGALADPDELVAEAAAFGLGELVDHPVAPAAVGALAAAATGHPDALVREAAVAALGSLGDPAGLPAVLAACGDKPAVRRRAVLALAAFEGPEVEAALQRALGDRDWQVRQAAEDLTALS